MSWSRNGLSMANKNTNKNKLVSVRLPSSLVEELRVLAEKNHYLDVSELIRSVLRQRWFGQKDPLSYQIKKLRDDIEQDISNKASHEVNLQLIEELERIKRSLLNTPDGGRKP